MVPNMQNQGSNFGTGSKFRNSEPVPGTGSAISVSKYLKDTEDTAPRVSVSVS